MHKDVWILHPEHPGTTIAKGRSGTHYRVQKSKMPKDRPFETDMLWVLVEDVFVLKVTPIYAAKQTKVRSMEDALPTTSGEAMWVMWNTDFLLEVS